jgi:hypothetical protein
MIINNQSEDNYYEIRKHLRYGLYTSSTPVECVPSHMTAAQVIISISIIIIIIIIIIIMKSFSDDDYLFFI